MVSPSRPMIQPAVPDLRLGGQSKMAPSPPAEAETAEILSALDLGSKVDVESKGQGGEEELPRFARDTATAVNMQPRADDDVFVDGHNTVNPIASRIATSLSGPYGYASFAPRSDRIAQMPNPGNAQGLYPPDALIFVANLSSQRSDDQLEISCKEVFDVYGPCYIKIKHDRNQHPFAFVQYETAVAAKEAIDNSADLVIDGRKIRMERAKAERSVILSKRDGGIVSTDEASGLLDRFGPLEQVIPLPSDSLRYGMSTSVYIKFAFWADCRDALRGFQNNSLGYVLVLAPSTESRAQSAAVGGGPRSFLQQRSTVDQKSIFVGNLPEGVTRRELEDLFAEFGNIIQVNIIRKPYGEDSVNIFAFIEYDNPRSAEYAAMAERSLHNVKLRVEPKEYSARRSARQHYAPATPMRQNTPRQYVQPQAQRGMGYNDGFGFGPMQTPPGFFPGFPMQSYTPSQVVPFNTPPSANMARMLPSDMFSPSPAHGMPPKFGAFVQYGSPAQHGREISNIPNIPNMPNMQKMHNMQSMQSMQSIQEETEGEHHGAVVK